MPRDDSTRPVSPLRLANNDGPHPSSWLSNTEAEQSLLGAILIRNQLYEQAVDLVRPADFANAVHGRIYAAIGKLIDRGQVADHVALKNHFAQDGSLPDIGGVQYLARLVESTVTFVGVPDYARSIADLARRRNIVMACEDAIADAAAVDIDRPAATIIEEFDRRLIELADGRLAEAEPVAISAAVDAAIEAAELVYKANGKITGITTGLVDLDRKLGGLHPADLVVVAGRPAMGKTAMALTIADAAARAGNRVLLFELEMAAPELGARQIGAVTGISAEQQRTGPISGPEIDTIIAAREHFRHLPLTIDDTPAASVGQLRARSRRHKRRHGLDLIIVDYLQLLLSDKTRPENRVQEVSAITRGLKVLAKEMRVPVVALSQLSRAVEQREDKRPLLADLRESGSIEQDADVVMFLYREEEYLRRAKPQQRLKQAGESYNDDVEAWEARVRDAAGRAEVIIAKNRHGSCRTVLAHFDARRTVFKDLYHGEIR